MTQNVSQQFTRELRSFFVVALLNLVFGALAIAFGVQFIVTASIATAQSGVLELLFLVQIVVGIVAAMLGMRWILSSARILRGISPIRREYRRVDKPVPDETITDMIIRLVSHYRENGRTIRRMIMICALGGCIYVTLGAMNVYQSVIAGSPLVLAASLSAAGVNIAIGILALRSSFWFHRYTTAWDQRLEKASQSEKALQQEIDRV